MLDVHKEGTGNDMFYYMPGPLPGIHNQARPSPSATSKKELRVASMMISRGAGLLRHRDTTCQSRPSGMQVVSQVSSIHRPWRAGADVDAMRMRRNHVDGHLEAVQRGKRFERLLPQDGWNHSGNLAFRPVQWVHSNEPCHRSGAGEANQSVSSGEKRVSKGKTRGLHGLKVFVTRNSWLACCLDDCAATDISARR